eukprot:7839019-Pyramimonas_sp.AAC.1
MRYHDAVSPFAVNAACRAAATEPAAPAGSSHTPWPCSALGDGPASGTTCASNTSPSSTRGVTWR